jgi:hypothetical protein
MVTSITIPSANFASAGSVMRWSRTKSRISGFKVRSDRRIEGQKPRIARQCLARGRPIGQADFPNLHSVRVDGRDYVVWYPTCARVET